MNQAGITHFFRAFANCLAEELFQIFNRRSRFRKNPRARSIMLTIVALATVIGMGAALYGAILLLAYLTPDGTDLWYSRPLGVLLVIIFGILFFLIRSRAPLIYNLVVIELALLLAWGRPPNLTFSQVISGDSREAILVMMTGGVYVLVQAIVNCWQTIEPEMKRV